MSDNEDEFNVDEDGGEDADGDDENLIENTYYTAKGSIDDNLDEAIENFNLVLDLEETKGKWGFKALKQLIKCNLKANKSKDVIANYKKLMTYLSGVPDVSKNDGEKAINKVIGQLNNVQDQKLQDTIYTITLQVLKTQKNEKLWFNIKSKQAKLFSDARDFEKLGEILAELKQYCLLPDGTEDTKKASYLLEVYTYEITMLSDLGENKKLKAIYDKCTNIMNGGAVVLNPRVTGVIRECGGKMYMRDKNWEHANTDFWDAFTSYDEAGNPRRIQCLKYLVLANMLSASQINPFDSPQAKPYKNHNEIVAMNNLVSSFQRGDIKEFEKILKNNKATISDDSFLAEYLPDLYKSIRIKVLLKLIKPYTRIHMKFVAQELNITQESVEGLCVDMILDQLFDGHVDQLHQVIEMGANKNAFTRYKAIADWTKKLGDVHSAVMNKVWA